jgi:hypothetical protein
MRTIFPLFLVVFNVWNMLLAQQTELIYCSCPYHETHTTMVKPSNCWPKDLPPCQGTLDYAPDAAAPELTPIKYIKFVLHVFQTPDESVMFAPGNFSNSERDIEFMRSWFHHPQKGFNAILANICAPMPQVDTFRSPHIGDSRVRFLFDGVEGEDLFFYKNHSLWGGGYYCNNFGNSYNQLYRTGVDSNKIVQSDPDILNAVHIFMTSVSINKRDSTVCYGEGGYTMMFSSCGRLENKVGIVTYGDFYRTMYDLTGQSPNNSYSNQTPEPENTPYRGFRILGEWLHMVTVDHPGKNSHLGGNTPLNDHCSDTPWPDTDNNMMDTYLPSERRCALTRCQLGRMHHFLEHNRPVWVRDARFGYAFPAPDSVCIVIDTPLVVKSGQQIVWQTEKSLRSDLVIERNASLTLSCRLLMPAEGKIVVKAGGTLILDGAVVRARCSGTTWYGMDIEGPEPNEPVGHDPRYKRRGSVVVRPGTVIEDAANETRY